jgi:serine palmitoyltransferase
MPIIARIRGTITNRVRGRLNSNGSANSFAQQQQHQRGSNKNVPPEVELVSATSSDAHSLDDDSFCSSSPSSTSPYRPYNAKSYKGIAADTGSSSNDPYGDVRARLEVLASHDRARHALHTNEGPKNKDGLTLVSTEASDDDGHVPLLIAYTCYLGYAIIILLGHFRDFCALIFGGRFYKRASDFTYPSENRAVYASLLTSWENFYSRRLYTRLQDCFNRPIASMPAATLQVLERVSHDGQKSMKAYGSVDQTPTRTEYAKGPHFVATHDGRAARQCLNLGSYNYLRFADDWHKTCAKSVMQALVDFPVSTSSSLLDYGRTDLHDKMEAAVAKFVGKEDAICLNMGFNTNATTIPTLVGPGDLVISDELNHTSIVNGARASGAAIRIFRHNDMTNLEAILREAIIMGKPRTRRPWSKIMVIVEGIYSMEGSYCDLKNVVRLCKKYGAYVYLDEAHSIGAMGETGRGCAEYAGVDPADIDIMMGTFTKSFGAMGGYIAASRETITFLRKRSPGSVFHNSLSPVVSQQVLSALRVRPTR